jgi:hypothetical protein
LQPVGRKKRNRALTFQVMTIGRQKSYFALRSSSMTTPATISAIGHHFRSSGHSCGTKPRFDNRNIAPTTISTHAPKLDRIDGWFLLRFSGRAERWLEFYPDPTSDDIFIGRETYYRPL